ncbi:CoA ester lyase [Deinococcus sp.]|uniref:HpcH/HpaI aldolase/citrate lyase family protein n=1 Tax=Deinococcus sp. TaxID=47478 RepID=UPI0025F6C1EC|nr:CoA ester lyase [Deinococcus sp.]
MKRPHTALYVPGDKPRAIEKARTLGADLIILDLEDAVAPEHKERARHNVCAALRQGFAGQGFAGTVLVRLNSFGSAWEHQDRGAVLAARPDGLVLPKVEESGAVRSFAPGLPLWLMIETPRGVLAAPDLAAEHGVAGLIAGSNDLSAELRARTMSTGKLGPGRTPLLYSLSRMVLAARAHGKFVLDGVYNDYQDEAGFEAECVQGRELGFDGKTLIHPAQLEAARRVYGVSAAEAQAARELLDAWAAGRAAGHSLSSLRGRMIEELHVREAQETLEEWEVGSGQ